MRHIATNPVALDVPNYPQNMWWVAATCQEIANKPIQRWIAGLPIVLFRRDDGEVSALDDRCPHRWAPLSMGYVEGGNIVCRYHGFRFGKDGRCTGIPTQNKIPSVIRVATYPVVEKPPFIWICMGDPAFVDTANSPQEMPWAVDASRVTASGAMEVACNFMALKENVLDLSHFGYVHANTLAVTDWTRPPKVENTDAAVSYRQEFRDTVLPAHYGVPTGIGCDRPVARTAWGSYVSPALQLAGVDIENTSAAPGERRNFALRICHATTPIDLGRTNYWWYVSQDYGHGENATEILTQRIAAAFDEDKAILEASETLVRQDRRRRDYLDVSVACDRAGVVARRRLQRLTETEASHAVMPISVEGGQ